MGIWSHNGEDSSPAYVSAGHGVTLGCVGRGPADQGLQPDSGGTTALSPMSQLVRPTSDPHEALVSSLHLGNAAEDRTCVTGLKAASRSHV